MWWPGINAQIEQITKTCQLTQKAPGPSALHPRTWPGSPWQRIHVDFASPFQGHRFMVVIEAHSKWPEVSIMSSITTSTTIQVLRGLFSRYGLPEVLVSDNGPQFTSSKAETFMKSNGVKHTPHSTTKEPSSMLFLRCDLRSCLDLLKPTRTMFQQPEIGNHLTLRQTYLRWLISLVLR